MRASSNRSIRFVFDSVADAYVSGRPDMPLEAVLSGAEAVDVAQGATVLEIGAGAGQLTGTLVEAGFAVVALEPGADLRRRAAERVPGSMGAVAASPQRAELLAELASVLGTESFEVIDLVFVVAARAAEA